MADTEIEIQEMGDIEIQEVEVEPVPVEMPIETVETTETIEVQPMIALQPLPDAQEEITLQTCDDQVVGDPNFIYIDNIPVPAPEVEISSEECIPTTSKKGKGGKKKGTKLRGQIGESALNELSLVDASSALLANRKWEQKQVQIKTLEGEFSVTMWASGKFVFGMRKLRYARH